MCAAKSDVRLTPNSDRESGLPQTAMSALPPRADMCGATSDVRFGPKADSCTAAKSVLFDHLVAGGEQQHRNSVLSQAAAGNSKARSHRRQPKSKDREECGTRQNDNGPTKHHAASIPDHGVPHCAIIAIEERSIRFACHSPRIRKYAARHLAPGGERG